MHRYVLFSTTALACLLASAQAGPKGAKKPPTETNDFGVTPQTPRLIVFQNDDLALALQVLARQAKINLGVSDELKDTITLRLKNKTPREAIDTIIATKELIVTDQNGTLYIRPRNPPAPNAAPSDAADPQAFGNLAATAFTPVITGVYDSLLDFAAQPETAARLAKATRALYDALVAEGFTKEEAFQIVLNDRGLPTAGSKK